MGTYLELVLPALSSGRRIQNIESENLYQAHTISICSLPLHHPALIHRIEALGSVATYHRGGCVLSLRFELSRSDLCAVWTLLGFGRW